MKFTEQDLIEMAQGYIELRNTAQTKRGKSTLIPEQMFGAKEKTKDGEILLPEYWEGYNLAARFLEQAKPHAQKGYFPVSLFANRAPNETPQETTYIRSNYQQTTLTVFKDFVEINGRATHSNNWNIEYQEDEEQYVQSGETLQNYIESQIPEHESLDQFTFSFLPPLKYMDAMGVVVVKPEYIPVEEVNGENVISQTEMIRPKPYFFHTTRVIRKEEDFALIEWDEFSEVQVGDKLVNEGIVYYAFDKNEIWRIYQSGKKDDNNFSVELFWSHNIDILPVRIVGGSTVQIDDVKLQMSPFLYCVDILNNVLIDSTMLLGVKAMCGYPYRIMVGDICEFKMTIEGEIQSCDNGFFRYPEGRRIACKECHGTGMRDRVSPYGTLLVRKEGRLDNGDNIDPTKAMAYVAPSVEMPKFIREEIESGLTRAYDTLHLKRSSVAEGGNKVTATENINDQKALIASITTNTKQLFDIYEWLVLVHGKMRYADRYKAPKITRPTNLDVFVESDDLKKINDAINANQPTFVIQTLIYNYLQKLYYNDKESRLLFDLILTSDRLLTQTNENIDMGLANGSIEIWERILHDSALTFVNELKLSDPTFFEQDPSVQVEQLKQKAKDVAAAISTNKAATTSVIPTAQQRLNTILGQA